MRKVPDGLTYVRKHVSDLTPDEYKACYRLNMGSRGEMQDRLAFERTEIRQAHVHMLWNGKELISWVLRFKEGDHRWTVYVYTRTTSRRRGYGQWLVKESKRGMRSVNIYPWDDRSASFYSRINPSTVYNKGHVSI